MQSRNPPPESPSRNCGNGGEPAVPIVLAVTSVLLLYQVDGYLSIDSQVFGGITLFLLGYFVTLRTDIRME